MAKQTTDGRHAGQVATVQFDPASGAVRKGTTTVPPPPETITIEVPLILTVDPGRASNTLYLRFSDCIAEVSSEDDETGVDTPLGSVGGCVGGSVQCSDKATGLSYSITPLALWTAFQEALQPYLDERESVGAISDEDVERMAIDG